MAVGTENIGGVSVLIGGDWSPLVAAFGEAQGAARQAGAAVASAFTGGAAAAPQIVDQFGRAVSSAGSAAAAAAPKVAAAAAAQGVFVTQIQATSGALRVLEGSGGIRAAERFLTMIPGLGAALQAAFPVVGAVALGVALTHVGEEAYKAGQNFLYLKDAAQQAIKIGADLAKEAEAAFAHLSQMQARALDEQGKHMDAAQERQKALLSTPIQLPNLLDNEEIKGALDTSSNKANWTALTSAFSETNLAGIPQRIDEITAAMRRVQAEMDAASKNSGLDPLGLFNEHYAAQAAVELQLYGQALEFVRTKQQELAQEVGDAGTEGLKKQQEETGRSQAARIDAQIQANERLVQIARQQAESGIALAREQAVAEDAAYISAQARAVGAAQAEVAAAQQKQEQLGQIALAARNQQIADIRARASAESEGKTPQEQADIQIKAQGEIAAARDKYTQETLALQNQLAEAFARLSAVIAGATREEADEQKRFNEELARTADYWQKEQEAAVKAGAERATRAYDQQGRERGDVTRLPAAIRLQGTPVGDEMSMRNAGIQTVAAQQQQIAQLEELLKLERARNQPAQMQLQLEEQILKARIALAAASGQADFPDKLKLAADQLQQILIQWRSIDLGNVALDLAGVVQKLPQSLGTALADSIFDAPRKGQSKGQEVGDAVLGALKNAGKQLFGELITQGIEKLIAQLVGQAVFQSAQTSATIANTAAVIANTAAQGASAGVGAAGAAVGVGGAIASTVSTAVTGGITQAMGSIVGGLIAAAGSIVGGVISGTMSAAGSIVGGVISGTMSAGAELIGSAAIVKAVNQTTAAVYSLRTSLSGTATGANSQQPQPSGTSFWGQIASDFGVGALPVNIVAISPLALTNGFLSLFGFADGGSPPVGVPSIVGERGPELFIPHSAGVIVPHEGLKKYAGGAGNWQQSLYGSGGGGDTHFHGDMHFHAHGITNPRQHAEMAVREIPNVLKARSSKFSRYSS